MFLRARALEFEGPETLDQHSSKVTWTLAQDSSTSHTVFVSLESYFLFLYLFLYTIFIHIIYIFSVFMIYFCRIQKKCSFFNFCKNPIKIE